MKRQSSIDLRRLEADVCFPKRENDKYLGRKQGVPGGLPRLPSLCDSLFFIFYRSRLVCTLFDFSLFVPR